MALDLSVDSMNINKSRLEQLKCLDRVRFVQGNLLDIENLGLGKFDYIQCCGVIHHLPDPSEAVKKLYEVLKSNWSFSGYGLRAKRQKRNI